MSRTRRLPTVLAATILGGGMVLAASGTASASAGQTARPDTGPLQTAEVNCVDDGAQGHEIGDQLAVLTVLDPTETEHAVAGTTTLVCTNEITSTSGVTLTIRTDTAAPLAYPLAPGGTVSAPMGLGLGHAYGLALGHGL